jgi:hypothetical protein
LTDAGGNLVETVPMPRDILAIVGQFIATHHVERPFIKRRREPAEFGREKNGQGDET